MEGKLLYGSMVIVLVFSCTGHNAPVADEPLVKDVPPPVSSVQPPGQTNPIVTGDDRFRNEAGSLEHEVDNAVDQLLDHEVGDDRELPEEIDPVRAFNNAITDIVERSASAIKLKAYVELGSSDPNRYQSSDQSSVLFRYVLLEDLPSYTQAYDYRYENAPDLDQLVAEGYIKVYLDNRDEQSSHFWYGKYEPNIKVLWEGNDSQPTLHPNSLILFRLFKGDETIYDEIEGRYRRNDFTTKRIFFDSPLSKVSWRHNAYYKADPRYYISGTEVVLILYLHVAFRDERTDSIFYRLVPWDMEVIKANPAPYTYTIDNPRT